MRVFLDSSALAKRYIAESGSSQISLRCENADEIVLSILCVPEILSAFNRLRRERKLSLTQYRALKSDLSKDIMSATMVSLDNSVLLQTIACLEQQSLRTLDAIHIASAKEKACDLFISADRKQCSAASAIGLKTELIV